MKIKKKASANEPADEEDSPVKSGIKKTKKLRRSAVKEQAIVDKEDESDEPFANFGKQVVEGAVGESEESVTDPEEYSEGEYTDEYEESGDEYDEYEGESYSEPEESEKESIDNAKAQKV